MSRLKDGRSGFTLVEMLVATALVIFIMVIMTQAFVIGMDTFRQLKTVGDMQEKLRSASTIMSKDLANYELDTTAGTGIKISQTNLFAFGPPISGFFRIWQGSQLTAASAGPSDFYEGVDGDGIPSYRVTDHMLHFSVKLRSKDPNDVRREYFASASLPAPPANLPNGLPGLGAPGSRFQEPLNTTTTYNYQWYEVAYYLSPTPDVTPSGLPRWTLIRRQRLCVPHPDNPAPPNTGIDVNNLNPRIPVQAGYGEVSCRPDPASAGSFYFNDQSDLTVPQRRFGMNQTAGAGGDGGLPLKTSAQGYYPIISDSDTTTNGGDPGKAGSDILLTDVLSFQVMVLLQGANPAQFVDLFDASIPAAASGGNSNFTGAGNPRVFDTWSSKTDATYDYSTWATPNTAKSLPLNTTAGNTSIVALQITLRIWDAKTQQTRQLTFVQNM
jgi:type II secretory pathway pseudopilin PulG